MNAMEDKMIKRVNLAGTGRDCPIGFYGFYKFVFVLNSGFATTMFYETSKDDFIEIRNQIDAKCG